MKTKIFALSVIILSLCSMVHALPTMNNEDLAELKTEIRKVVNDEMPRYNYTDLLYAINQDNIAKVQRIVNSNSISKKYYSKAIYEYSGTQGSRPKLLESLAILIENGADVNKISKDYGAHHFNTPLSEASSFRNVEMGEFLIKHGAYVNKAGEDAFIYNHWLLAEASQDSWNIVDRQEEMVKLLIDNGADVNLKLDETNSSFKYNLGDTPLDVSVHFFGSKRAAALLIKYGAEVTDNVFNYINSNDILSTGVHADCGLYKYLKNEQKKQQKRKEKRQFFQSALEGLISAGQAEK